MLVKLCCLLLGCGAKKVATAQKTDETKSLIKQNSNNPSISAYNCPWTSQTEGKLQTGQAGKMPSSQIDILIAVLLALSLCQQLALICAADTLKSHDGQKFQITTLNAGESGRLPWHFNSCNWEHKRVSNE